ncbi:MAG: DsbE family thiol:disulfide interchange protein [Gammaproteobacteria bacterium]|nr:MAG: DsbE family thiol:disulfide interchange protein [Gammaproteobacteria bacterium]
MNRFVLPLAAFALLTGLLYVGLKLNPREVPSPLINKPAPEFSLPKLGNMTTQVKRDDLIGQVWLLNVWASWCVSCRQEHPLLVDFSKKNLVPIYGLDYKDNPDDARNWLRRLGNPYSTVLVDMDGRVGIDYGVYGVPETYVIDKKGVIRYKQIGPVTPSALHDKMIPLILKLKNE